MRLVGLPATRLRRGVESAMTGACLALWGIAAGVFGQELTPETEQAKAKVKARGDDQSSHMDAARMLDIHFEDDHSGSFFHLAETLALDEPHALVLFDSHSDASAVARSDDLRGQLRKVRSVSERGERLEEWRHLGRLQVFNWIEPLMPRPLDSVWWVAPEFEGDEEARMAAEVEAHELLDARLEFERRDCGSLADRFHTMPLDLLEKKLPADLPLIVSLDLDYFMDLDGEEISERFEQIWLRILALPNLRVLTMSLSRPWLRDDAQAQQLTELAMRAALALKNATVRFEPYAPRGPDRSELARHLATEGKVPQRLDLSLASAALRSLLIQSADRIEVRYQSERWQRQLQAWQAESGDWRIVVDDHFPSVDGIWRVPSSQVAALRIRSAGGRSAASRRVRWILLRPDQEAYDILPDWTLGTKFVEVAAALVRMIEEPLGETLDGALADARWRAQLDQETGWGSLELAAEVEVDGEWQRTPTITVRVFDEARGPFLAALTEQFQLPYVFGAGFLHEGNASGPETEVGNDCANYLVYAWRRCGRRLPWCNPAQLRRQLDSVAERCVLGETEAVRIAPVDVERGVVIDCDSHVAALWEDRAPVGVLDGGDLVLHHLGGVPERISLSELLAARPHAQFAVRRMADADGGLRQRVQIGGDICLAGEGGLSLGEETDVVAARVANLETALTDHVEPAQKKNFLFKAPMTAAGCLRRENVTAVSLANNHSGDFGDSGLHDTVAALEKAGVGHFGTMIAGATADSWKIQPWRLKIEGMWLAFFGVNLIEVADDDLPPASALGAAAIRIVELPRDLALLAEAIDEADRRGDRVIVMPHWGEEYVAETTESQRAWARWLIEKGADAIVGAHSHRAQPLDFYLGRPVFFSVGNLYFPGDGGPEGFHDPFWAEFDFPGDGSLTMPRLVPAIAVRRARESSGPNP